MAASATDLVSGAPSMLLPEETPAELKARLKEEQNKLELEQRMKNLKRRMERAKKDYDALEEKVNKMKRNFKRPIPNPKVAPYKPLNPPPPEVRRKKFLTDVTAIESVPEE